MKPTTPNSPLAKRLGPEFRAKGPAVFEHVASGIEFVLVGPGTALVGLSEAEARAAAALPDPIDAEVLRPAAEVELPAFLISRFPVQAGTVRRLSAAEALPELDASSAKDDYPAYVPRETALGLARRLGARLPTEAEWECACRGGTRTLFVWGDTLPPRKKLAKWLDLARTSSLEANGFGLSALFAGEWCADEWAPSHAPGAKRERGVYVIKGGGSIFWPWQDAGEWRFCMPAQRMPSTGLMEDRRAAFRLVRELPEGR